jgi:hypothetical protein
MGIHELPLREAFAFCRCLEILVGHVQIAVTQVIADHQLVFAHLCQHGSHRVPKRVPAYAGDADPRHVTPKLGTAERQTALRCLRRLTLAASTKSVVR